MKHSAELRVQLWMDKIPGAWRSNMQAEAWMQNGTGEV